MPRDRRRIGLIYGTRPEAIKLAPIVKALAESPDFEAEVVSTGQHREMLDQVHTTFGISATVDLDIHEPGQTITEITSRALSGLATWLPDRNYDAVLVQGDTTTTFAAALAAFLHRIPVVHVEAGLRTGKRYSPFPEEINRRLTSQLASLHLAPTLRSRANLEADGIAATDIVVTGNSVIDALQWTVGLPWTSSDPSLSDRLAADSCRRIVLVTAHRRESWGEPLESVGRALAALAERYADTDFIIPIHRNPIVRKSIAPAAAAHPNVVMIEPLPYAEFCHLMRRAHLIVTDSGGVQEEAPSLGKPVLVTREDTERPEAVEAGTVRMVGTKEDRIVAAVSELLDDPDAYEEMAQAVNPYGDGEAARRTVEALRNFFGDGVRPDEFESRGSTASS